MSIPRSAEIVAHAERIFREIVLYSEAQGITPRANNSCLYYALAGRVAAEVVGRKTILQAGEAIWAYRPLEETGDNAYGYPFDPRQALAYIRGDTVELPFHCWLLDVTDGEGRYGIIDLGIVHQPEKARSEGIPWPLDKSLPPLLARISEIPPGYTYRAREDMTRIGNILITKLLKEYLAAGIFFKAGIK